MLEKVFEIKHPLIKHKLSLMRMKETNTMQFRNLMEEISLLLAYEVTRDFPVKNETIQTPLKETSAPFLKGKNIAVISILRAGSGLAGGILKLIPTARLGHIGLYRDHKTLKAIEYYFKVPPNIQDSDVIIVDPMLATGNSAKAAILKIKELNPKSIRFLCLLSAPEGLRALNKAYPDIPIYTAAIDENLNDKGYILPGLGDAGDRLYGTK